MPKFILGFYELDRCYGGPEEGGWWFDTETLVRPLAVVASEDKAMQLCQRANRLLSHLQRKKRGIGSMAYDGGRHCVSFHETTLPKFFPEERPHYE